MGISASWENTEQTIIRLEFQGRWTWTELDAASDAATVLLDTVDHVVNFIVDLRKANPIPGDLMSHAENIASGTHPRRGSMVVVGANRFLRGLASRILTLFPAGRDVIFAKDMDDAYQIIARLRAAE